MKPLTSHIIPIVSSIILFASVPALYAWTGPVGTPPANNVSAPINVSDKSQNKLGALGLGGLAVFGKTLLTEVSGYTLPIATKPTMLLGVNGAIGAKEYCDENGTNCVSTLGGGSSENTGNSNAQVVTGWPNKILCEGGSQKSILYMNGISGVGYPEVRVTYTSFADAGPHTQLQFNYLNGQYLSRAATTDGYATAIDACVAKGNIKNQAGFN